MSPCCGDKKKMGEPEGLFEMKFVGRPNGKLMRGAPGNYEHAKVYRIPYRHSKFKFWELVEEEPVLKAPEVTAEDSVFEEHPFEEVELGDVEDAEDINSSPALIVALEDIEPRDGIFGRINLTSTQGGEVTVSEPEPDITVTLKVLEASTRAQLMAFIKSQGADPNPEGKRYVSHAELLEISRGLLPNAT